MRQAFDLKHLPATPWKNGGGLTREIVCQPEGASVQDFDWRVSLAQIAANGPFSAFPGIDRVITLLEGDGVRLGAANAGPAPEQPLEQPLDHRPNHQLDHLLDTPWAPFAFPGEVAIEARLLGGPCLDLNVMTRREVCQARVQVLRQRARGQDLAGADEVLGEVVLALQGHWRIETGKPGAGQIEATFELAPDEGLWCAAEAPLAGVEPAGGRAAAKEDPVLIHIAILGKPL